MDDAFALTQHQNFEVMEDTVVDELEWDDWNATGLMKPFETFPPIVKAANLELNKQYKVVAIRRLASGSVRKVFPNVN